MFRRARQPRRRSRGEARRARRRAERFHKTEKRTRHFIRMETTTVQLLSRIAGSGTTLMIAAPSAESAQGIAQQLEFFGVEPVIVEPSEISKTLERREQPLALLAVAVPGPAAERVRREVMHVALARTELPLCVYAESGADEEA